MAPQIHALYEDPSLSYDMYKSDIFALGVILFSLVLGKIPFGQGNVRNQVYKLIGQGKVDEFWNYHRKQLLKK